jgi:nucleoid DNA-binding protein/cell division septation protein DedD
MTKAELIRKLARKAGATDPEAKIFFEVFLQQCAILLNPGEAVNIKGLGFFKLKKGRIKKLSNPSEETDPSVLSDFIVYTPSENVSDNNDDNLIFNIPAFREAEYNAVDSFFSLSIGKPVIPLRGVKDSGFFVPLAGNELRRLIESKAENLLTKSETIKNYVKGSEFLYITPESYSKNQFEISWEEKKERQAAGKKDASGTSNITWDFGEDITRQIEEDSLLDLEKEELQSGTEEHLDWNFGVQEADDSAGTEFEKTAEPYTEPAAPEKSETKQPEFYPEEDIIPAAPSREEAVKEEPEVKQADKENITWDFGEQHEIKADDFSGSPDLYKNYIEPKPDKEGFIQVPNKRKTYDIELPKQEQSDLDTIIKEEAVKEQDNDSSPADDFYGDNTLAVEKDYRTTVPEQNEFYSGRKTTPIFIIALIVIIIVAAALYFFLKNGMLLKQDKGKNPSGSETEKTPAMVIERKYDVPVSYPYPSENSSAAGNIEQTAGEQPEVKKEEQETGKTQLKSEEKVIAAKVQAVKNEPAVSNEIIKVSKEKLTKVKENIYKDGNNFVIQASAWKSKIKAQGEAKKLRNKGYTAFVEEVQIPGRGTWYRVRISNIKSLTEAEKFLQ